MSTFYIIRHGHKEQGNFYNPILKHQDQPLSQKGKLESVKLWSYLFDKDISQIYISEYKRTYQTAIYLSEKLGVSPLIDKRLNEFDDGIFHQLNQEAIEKNYADFWRSYVNRDANYRFPEGESCEEASFRVSSFVEEKRKTRSPKNIVIISHAGLIRQLICYILGLPSYKNEIFHISPCGITEIVYGEQYEGWKLMRLNQKIN